MAEMTARSPRHRCPQPPPPRAVVLLPTPPTPVAAVSSGTAPPPPMGAQPPAPPARARGVPRHRPGLRAGCGATPTPPPCAPALRRHSAGWCAAARGRPTHHGRCAPLTQRWTRHLSASLCGAALGAHSSSAAGRLAPYSCVRHQVCGFPPCHARCTWAGAPSRDSDDTPRRRRGRADSPRWSDDCDPLSHP